MKYSAKFRVEPGSKVKLGKIDPEFKGRDQDRDSAQARLEQQAERLRELQYRLYAENKRSLLIILQAMDAGGKDGTIKHVLGSMNPQGARVHSFKVPTHEEAAHDFLWRVHRATPRCGEVAVFNRSHYEDVLVTRVHNLVPKKVWSRRYDLINEFEKNLFENGTTILKFFLHISEDEQLRRFKQRIDDPKRWWKISESDYSEREFWDDYTSAFEDVLSRCSTDYAPWYVIPANVKWFRNLAVSDILVETLESLRMEFPKPTVNLDDIKQKYHKAEQEANHKNGRDKKGEGGGKGNR